MLTYTHGYKCYTMDARYKARFSWRTTSHQIQKRSTMLFLYILSRIPQQDENTFSRVYIVHFCHLLYVQSFINDHVPFYHNLKGLNISPCSTWDKLTNVECNVMSPFDLCMTSLVLNLGRQTRVIYVAVYAGNSLGITAQKGCTKQVV